MALTKATYSMIEGAPANVLDYGAVGDGVADDTAAVQAAVDTGRSVYFPEGTYLIKNSILLTQSQTLFGDGMQKSILKCVASAAVTNLNSFSVQADYIFFNNLTFDVNLNGQVVCRAITFDADVEHIYADQCEFVSTNALVNNVAMWINGFDVKNLYVTNCYFDTVQFGIAKDNSDTSTQQYTNWINCSFYGCSDGVNINSPSALSAWTDIVIANCNFERMLNFSVSFAGPQCGRVSVTDCNFYDIDLDAVHIEDRATAISVEGCNFSDCCKLVNNVGNVSVITGSYNISITNCHFQLDVSATPIGISVQEGGGDACYNVSIVANTFRCTSFTQSAVFISSADGIVISDNIFTNLNVGAKCPKFMVLAFSVVTGSNNSFNNPAVLVDVDNNSFGSLSLSSINGNLTSFAFLSGNTNGSTSICFESFDITRAFTCDATSSVNNPLFPAGTIFDGIVGIRFVQNGIADAFVVTSKLKYNNTTLTSADLFQFSGTSSSQFVAFNKTGSDVCGTGFRGTPVTGKTHVTFSGIYFP
jgi:pectate lyase